MKRIILAASGTVAALALATSAQAMNGSPAKHWCRMGDPPIQASTRTSCAFAGRALSDYYSKTDGWSWARLRVFSPTTHRSYTVTFVRTGGHMVTVTGPNGIWLRFGVEL